MNQSPKDLSLANIHQIYSGETGVRPRAKTDATPSYKTTNQFARESSHSGAAPNASSGPGKRPRRSS